MFSTFNGATADELWRAVRDSFMESDSLASPQQSRGGNTDELLHAALVLEDPRQRWIVAREPALNVAFALAEVVWILCGRRDSAFLNYFNTQLPNFAGMDTTYHGAYGHRLRYHFGVDQLERAYNVLTVDAVSRQVVLQVWDCKVDLPNDAGDPASADVPCNIVSFLKVRGGKLEWLQVMRSNDVFRGLPHNLVQFTMLQEVFAGWLGLELGNYHHFSDSLHVYESDRPHLLYMNNDSPVANIDSVAQPKADSFREWKAIECAVEHIIAPKTDCATIVKQTLEMKLLPAWANMLRVLSAEGLRRRNELALAEEVMNECNNPAYTQLWRRWVKRVGGKI